jgi:hypothetical protein
MKLGSNNISSIYLGINAVQSVYLGSDLVWGGSDPDALAFFDRVTAAGGTLSTTEKTAVNTLVVQMKTDGIWTKMKAIYPMVGASAAACAQNLRSSSFTGTFTAGWTFASTGATPNGTSAFMNTNFKPSDSTFTNFSWGYYINTDTLGIFGEFGVSATGYVVYDYPNLDGSTYTRYGGSDIIITAGNTLGFYSYIQISGNLKRFKNGTLTKTQANSPVSALGSSNLPYYFSGRNDNGTLSFPSNRKRTFNFIGDGLTDTEASNFYTAVQAMQVTLNRNV